MIEFENPLAFALIILIPVLYVLRYFKIFTSISFPLTLSDWNGNDFKWKSGFYVAMNVIVNIFCVAGFLSTVIALSDPVIHHEEKIYSSRGADILFVVDTSPSMAARDIAGMTRLDAARQAIKTVASGNDGAAVGLIEMARESAIVVPPTMDHDLFEKKLDSLTIGDLGDGTAIGTGLSTAVFHLETSRSPKKSIVLITDGENNAGAVHPYTAAHMAHDKNINLYVLGIGTKGTVPLEYTDPKTNKVYSGYLESNFDSAALSQVATEADGKYFGIETTGSLTQALSSVSKNESVAQSYQIKKVDTHYYNIFVIVAMILFAVSWIVRRMFLQEVL